MNRMLFTSLAAFATATFVFAASATYASTSSITYLGKPTNDLPSSYVPLGAFHHVPEHLSLFGKPVVELIGTAFDSYTATVEWPIVKALDQFGSFSGVKPANQNAGRTSPVCPQGAAAIYSDSPCGVPSFDFTHASYRSSCVSFRPRMLVDSSDTLRLSSLTPPESRILSKYGIRIARGANVYKLISDALYLSGHYPLGNSRLPLVSIGHYMEAHDLYVYPQNDFQDAPPFNSTQGRMYSPPGFLAFAPAQVALATHSQPKPPPGWSYTGSILTDVNTDANLMTALICRADGLKPGPSAGGR